MVRSDISLWGVALLAFLLFLAVAVYRITDRREMWRMLKVFGLMTGITAVTGLSVWAVYKLDAWWAYTLWLIVMMTLATGWCIFSIRTPWKQVLTPIVASLTVGLFVGGGTMMLCMHTRFFIPVLGILIAYLALSIKETIQTYQRALMHTQAHRQYMLANGASLLESLMPSIRRALRAAVQPQLRTMAQPLLVTMPLFFAGMLLGGVSPATTVIVMILLMIAAFVSSVVAAIVALYCFKR